MENTGIDEKINALAAKIFDTSRNVVFLNLRFLTKSVTMLAPVLYNGSFFTDGKRLYYDPKYIIKRYKKAERLPVHDFLHIILHCVFRHWYLGAGVDKKRWDAACDIAVESLIMDMDGEFFSNENISEKKAVIYKLSSLMRPLTAERLYSYFKKLDDTIIDEYAAAFRTDDHNGWYKPERREYEPEEKQTTLGVPGVKQKDETGDDEDGEDGKNPKGENPGEKEEDSRDDENNRDGGSGEGGDAGENDDASDIFDMLDSPDLSEEARQQALKQLEKLWRETAKQIQTELGLFPKKAGKQSDNMIQALEEINRERYDYTDFLRKFAVMGETMRLDTDNFDINYYSYGLSLYGDTALIEPLEYKEEKRIRDFVIAIDTSGSVSGAAVQAFVQKTYNILCSENSFFKKINIYIIQCDTEIREAVKITCRKEFEQYFKNMELHGLGGTDFRPVFDYVSTLISKKEFNNLKGLIYFTDGFGEFPAKKPPYETAFVFMRSDFDAAQSPDVPSWAIKIVLEDGDI